MGKMKLINLKDLVFNGDYFISAEKIDPRFSDGYNTKIELVGRLYIKTVVTIDEVREALVKSGNF